VVLNQIERDPPVIVDGHDFAIEKRIGREPFAACRNARELSSEDIPSPLPKSYAVVPSAGKAQSPFAVTTAKRGRRKDCNSIRAASLNFRSTGLRRLRAAVLRLRHSPSHHEHKSDYRKAQPFWIFVCGAAFRFPIVEVRIRGSNLKNLFHAFVSRNRKSAI
jgi:hypothetical protein